MLPRLWGNMTANPVADGTLAQNGTGKFSGIDSQSLSYLKGLGISHVWYTGILRHATSESTEGCSSSCTDWVKGKAGSPYSINDYYDVNPYLADDPDRRMQEFEALVERTHKAGLKVIIDFVPNHVARDYGTICQRSVDLGSEDDNTVQWKPGNDFFYYPGQSLVLPKEGLNGHGQTYVEMPAKASGNCYTPSPSINDWYDTIKINYCDTYTSTWEKMYSIVRFWAQKGVDGFRCDMAELVPDNFFSWMIAKIKQEFPEVIFIGEVYQKEYYRKYINDLGFDYLYDKSGLYDSLREIVMKNVMDSGVPVEQWQSTRRITWNWQGLGDLQSHMLNFLENHDEQRFASDFFASSADRSYAALYVSLLFNTCPFMLYFGEEVGERGMDSEGKSGRDGRTTIFDWWSVTSLRHLYSYIHGDDKALDDYEKHTLERYSEIMRFASSDKAILNGTTYDLCYCNLSSDGFNQDKHFAFLRHYEDETLLIVCNFSSGDAKISITIPEHAFQWMNIPKTDKLNPETPLQVSVGKYDGTIIRIQ